METATTGRQAVFCVKALRVPGLLAMIALLAVSGCAVPHDTSLGERWARDRLTLAGRGDRVDRCNEAFTLIDEAVAAAGRQDAQTAPVPGFPHLRVTRFLAAMGERFRGEKGDDRRAFDYWTGWLASSAIKARRVELANLPRPDRRALRRRLGNAPETLIEECTAILKSFDGQRDRAREILARTVNVPDNYIDFHRVIGIYPLSALAVLAGFENWKAGNLQEFAGAPSGLRMLGRPTRFAPPANAAPMPPAAVAALLRQSADNPLKVPRPGAAALRRLAAAFAPVYAVDVTGEYDRIGTPVVDAAGNPGLDIRVPRVYIQPSWAVFGGEPVLQISYLAWFSERPPRSEPDILAGRMDGLIWRVTIGSGGRPLIYDTIHPCGCYHLFFPVPPTRRREAPVDEPGEGTVVPVHAPTLRAGERMVLHIESGSHYLRAVSAAAMEGIGTTRYRFAPMDTLRNLPLADGMTRSLYDPTGIVAGTERAERYLLWPMGVPSPGAMRQWGTHATAFVGRRHFDDPHMLDRVFTR